jgi:hypothetical protein
MECGHHLLRIENAFLFDIDPLLEVGISVLIVQRSKTFLWIASVYLIRLGHSLIFFISVEIKIKNCLV